MLLKSLPALLAIDTKTDCLTCLRSTANVVLVSSTHREENHVKVSEYCLLAANGYYYLNGKKARFYNEDSIYFS